MTINEAIRAFLLNQLLKGNSPKTIGCYTYFLSRFSDYLNNKRVEALTIEDVNNYHLYLRDEGVRPVSLRTYMTHVRAFVIWLFEERYIEENIVNKMRVPKVPKKFIEILTDDEVKTILQSIDTTTLVGLRDFALFLLMLDCGLRKGEVETLMLENVNFSSNYIIVTGKGNRQRIVPLGTTTRRALLRYLARREEFHPETEYFFLKKDGQPFGFQTVIRIFRRMKFTSGVHRLHAHLLRHTYATNFLLNNLGDIYELSRILGHSELQTTQIYVNIANSYAITSKKNKLTYVDVLLAQ